jgi:hypothetical protein
MPRKELEEPAPFSRSIKIAVSQVPAFQKVVRVPDAPDRRAIYTSPAPAGDEAQLKPGARRMLETLVSRYPMKLTRSQLGTFSRMSPRSGSYTSYLSILRSRGFIVEEGDILYASGAGLDFMGGAGTKAPQSQDEVRDMWRKILKPGAARMFDVLLSRGDFMTREELGAEAGMSPASGSFTSYLSILRKNGLIVDRGQDVSISQDLL